MTATVQTNNPSLGFFGTLSYVLNEERAQEEWNKAVAAIQQQHPDVDSVYIRNYLDSPYGRHTADSVLDGISVMVQISTRKTRFEKHFKAVMRQTDQGLFED